MLAQMGEDLPWTLARIGVHRPESFEKGVDSKPNLELCQQRRRWIRCWVTTSSGSSEMSSRPTSRLPNLSYLWADGGNAFEKTRGLVLHKYK